MSQTRLSNRLHGTSQTFVQTPEHYFSAALDEFLIAEYPDSILSSVMHLSIALEIYIKKILGEFDPRIVKLNDSYRISQYIEQQISSAQLPPLQNRRTYVINALSTSRFSTDDKTISFQYAIELFYYLERVPNKIYRLLLESKELRNDVFHWGTDIDSFRLAKNTLYLIQWFLEYMERKNGSWLSGGLITIDPMGEKRRKLRDLRQFVKNEQAFNTVRRINKCRSDFQIYHRINAHVKRDVILQPQFFVRVSCPACNHNRMAMYSDMILCEICDFFSSPSEFDAMATNGLTFQTLYDNQSLRV